MPTITPELHKLYEARMRGYNILESKYNELKERQRDYDKVVTQLQDLKIIHERLVTAFELLAGRRSLREALTAISKAFKDT